MAISGSVFFMLFFFLTGQSTRHEGFAALRRAKFCVALARVIASVRGALLKYKRAINNSKALSLGIKSRQK